MATKKINWREKKTPDRDGEMLSFGSHVKILEDQTRYSVGLAHRWDYEADVVAVQSGERGIVSWIPTLAETPKIVEVYSPNFPGHWHTFYMRTCYLKKLSDKSVYKVPDELVKANDYVEAIL